MTKKYLTTSDAYVGSLTDVWHNAEYKCAPRGMPIRECLDYSFVVENPTSEPIKTFDEERNATIADYTSKEMELYYSGSNSAKDFGEASKFWLKLANPDGTVNSGYGYLIFKNKSHGNHQFEHEVEPKYALSTQYMRTPWEWALASLKRDKDTRQALVRFSLPEHAWLGNKDFTCTTHANFLIRDNKLSLSVVMRSNDLVKGTAYDMPFFCSLLDKMLVDLKDTYPDLKKGHYYHMSHSSHIYEKDEQVVLKMLGLVS